MIYLGIDPGVNGTAVMLWNDDVFVYKASTVRDAYDALNLGQSTKDILAVIEKVTRPTKLTRNAGEWVGLLTALGIPFKEIPPKKWQKHFGTFAKEKTRRKNQLKQIAQQLHPQIKWIHKTADAYLLAVYAREVAWQKN